MTNYFQWDKEEKNSRRSNSWGFAMLLIAIFAYAMGRGDGRSYAYEEFLQNAEIQYCSSDICYLDGTPDGREYEIACKDWKCLITDE